MRVTIVSEYCRPWPGGISEHVFHEARELQRRGHQVRVVSGPGAATDLPEGVAGVAFEATLRERGIVGDSSHVVVENDFDALVPSTSLSDLVGDGEAPFAARVREIAKDIPGDKAIAMRASCTFTGAAAFPDTFPREDVADVAALLLSHAKLVNPAHGMAARLHGWLDGRYVSLAELERYAGWVLRGERSARSGPTWKPSELSDIRHALVRGLQTGDSVELAPLSGAHSDVPWSGLFGTAWGSGKLVDAEVLSTGAFEFSARYGRLLPEQEEMAAVGARNPIGGMGVAMFGPTLLEYGTHEQKAEHIPFIARGERRWCQGFSEPGAGSDLASLSTKAEDKGDHFLVNGQKIWTSGAQFADWCFCLVRTDSTKKHEGISFLLIDMSDPGVEVRPILMISGASGQCQTFFTDVKVPKGNLMGELNKGWTYAKRLLQFERQGMGGGRGDGAGQRAMGPSLSERALSYVGKDDEGKLADSDLRTRLTENAMAQRAFSLTAQRVAAEARGSTSPSAATSIMKNAGMSANQNRAELTLEIMGNRGNGWEGEGFQRDELSAVRGWLGGKAGTIFGGSSEIQSNIISKRILTLPESSATQS